LLWSCIPGGIYVVGITLPIARAHEGEQGEAGMRSCMAFFALLGAALVFVAGSGCGGTEEGRTDIAKLEPPAPSVGAKATPKLPPPRFGSPPKSAMARP
jgi:hypothetical protein